MKRYDPHASAAECEKLFDSLEPRLALFAAPFLTDFPEIGDLASSQNTIVRMQTNMGMIDIELFDRAGPDGATGTAAPITTENFLRYIETQRYDGTFFHRSVPGFVIQGGGFNFNPVDKAVPVDAFDPIQNEFSTSRLNLERTLSMAKMGGDPNSATSQFFISLDDNEGLNEQNGGFSVFGRVIGGWDVVQSIAGLDISDVNQAMGEQPFQGPFTDTPLVETFAGGTPSINNFVHIIDIDVIKPSQSQNFYTHSLYFPDGYRSGNSTASIDLVNLNANSQVRYQIIARFETQGRDALIASGTLASGSQVTIPVYTSGDPTIDNVRGAAPFAYEIRATQPVAASINHTDFGATATQSFINPRDFEAEDLLEWNFALGQKGTGVPSFLSWQNLSDETAEITVTFTSENGETHQVVKSLEAFRRGGLNVNQLSGVPAGAYSVAITSDQPIVAGLSQYRAAPGRAAFETAPVGGPATEGVLPGAIIASDGQSILSVALPQVPQAPVVVDFSFILADGTVLTSSSLFVLDADTMRRDMDLSAAHGALPRDELFTIRYSVRDNTAPVSASYLALASGQTIRSAFQTVSSQQVHFASGHTNPESASGNEYISIFNPHLDPDVTVTFQLRFHFANGDIFAGAAGEGVIGPGQSVHIPVRELSLIMDRINQGSEFHVYGITVSTDIRTMGEETPGAIFAQFTRLDDGRATTTGPTLGGSSPFPRFFLNNPIFG